MEIVILRDLVASYASTWVNIATSQGTDTLRVGDVFRQSGSGEGAEEMKIDAFEVSPIPGGSRVLFLRAHHSTKPESYRLGAVLARLEEALAEPVPASRSRRKATVEVDLLSDV